MPPICVGVVAPHRTHRQPPFTYHSTDAQLRAEAKASALGVEVAELRADAARSRSGNAAELAPHLATIVSPQHGSRNTRFHIKIIYNIHLLRARTSAFNRAECRLCIKDARH